jgi:hypothetical protein
MSGYLIIAAIGAWLADGGLRKSDSKPIQFLVTQVQKVWKGNAHRFIGVFGLLLLIVSVSLHFTR